MTIVGCIVSVLDKAWHLYVGQSWVGTLTPTGSDETWYQASFSPGDGWGNFAPWFQRAYEAFSNGDEAGWNNWYSQLSQMGLVLTADDGESYQNPTIHIDGSSAWFLV